jgi:hypothetical protein
MNQGTPLSVNHTYNYDAYYELTFNIKCAKDNMPCLQSQLQTPQVNSSEAFESPVYLSSTGIPHIT